MPARSASWQSSWSKPLCRTASKPARNTSARTAISPSVSRMSARLACLTAAIDDWPWAFGRPLSPKAGGGGVNSQDAIGEADFDAFNPRGETACGVGVWISKF